MEGYREELPPGEQGQVKLHPTPAPLEFVSRWFSLHERAANDGRADRIVPAPLNQTRIRWFVDFVWTALQAGFSPEIDEHTGWYRVSSASLLVFAHSHWIQCGGDRSVLRRDGQLRAAAYDALRRHVDTATRALQGRSFWLCGHDFIAAYGDARGSLILREAMQRGTARPMV